MAHFDFARSLAKQRRHFFISLFIFAFAVFLGGIWPGWMHSSYCFKYLGCNAGFGGYDALVHFLGGITGAAFILWFIKKYPRWNILSGDALRDSFMVIAIVALAGVSWEIIEFSIDHFRILVLHQDIVHLGHLLQPSNSDTMGDLVFDLLGGIIGIIL